MTKAISALMACVLLIGALPASAADEIETLCQVGNPIQGVAQMCRCVSNRIAPRDRDAAIRAMRLTNDALSTRIPPDPAVWTDELVKAMTLVAAAESACLP